MEDEYEIIHSPLSRIFNVDGHTVNVEIYRGGEDPRWVLEVVDKWNNSTVWDDLFDTDEQALEVVVKVIEDEGIGALIGSEP